MPSGGAHVPRERLGHPVRRLHGRLQGPRPSRPRAARKRAAAAAAAAGVVLSLELCASLTLSRSLARSLSIYFWCYLFLVRLAGLTRAGRAGGSISWCCPGRGWTGRASQG